MLGGVLDLLGSLLDVVLTALGAGTTAGERPYARRRASRFLAAAEPGMLVRVDPSLQDTVGRFRPGFVGLYLVLSATSRGLSLVQAKGGVIAEWPWDAIRHLGLARDQPILRLTVKTPALVHTLDLPLISKTGAVAERAAAEAFLDELLALRDARPAVDNLPPTM